MNTIADTEVRILKLDQQEIAVQRNALTPLLRLPDELLVRITTDVTANSPLAFLTLMSVCVRLHSLVIDTPELWASIDFTWKVPVIDRFLDRAASHPLDIRLLVGECLGQEHIDRAIRCFPKIAQLSIDADIGAFEDLSMGRTFISKITVVNAPLLRTLRLSVDNRSLFSNLGVLNADMFLNLTTVKFDSVPLRAIPDLPAVRYVELSQTGASDEVLHGFLSRASACLEVIILVRSLYRYTAPKNFPPPTPTPLRFPHLKLLVIEDFIECVTLLVNILPGPAIRFKIIITEELVFWPQTPWSSISEQNGFIVSRLMQFWISIGGETGNFPSGRVDSYALGPSLYETITFGVENPPSDDTPSFFYSSPCCISESDLLLNSVEVFQLDCDRSLGADVRDDITMPLQLACLVNVHQVVISRAVGESFQGLLGTRMTQLEDWVFARHKEGRPLDSIRFRQSDKRAKGLFERLLKAGVARSVTWEDEDSDESPSKED